MMLSASSFWRASNCHKSPEMIELARERNMEPPTTKAALAGSEEHAELSRGAGDDYLRITAQKEREKFSCAPKQISREPELYLREDNGAPYFLGHPDSITFAPDKSILIQDFKTGADIDTDYWRDQLENYAVLANANFFVSFPIQTQIISKFYGVIPFTFEIDQVIAKADKILAFATWFRTDASRTLNPGPWCRYCPARLICDAAEKNFSHPLALSDMPAGEPGAAIVEKLKLLIALAKERLGWYEARVMEDPRFLAGKWEMSKGRELGEITGFVEAYVALRRNNISLEIVDTISEISYAKTRDALMKLRGISKNDAKQALQEILGELLTFKTTKGSLKKAKEPEPIEIEND